MNNIKAVIFLFCGFALSLAQVACSPAGGSGSLAPSVYYPSTLTGANVVPLSVGNCGVNGYENEPCISVTICTPGSTTNCQTIDNILVDTGSYGLKVFKSLVTVPLTQITASDGTGGLASCTSYLDGSGHWGPVVRADVVMGSLRTTQSIPIVLLDSTYGQPSKCSTKPDKSPSDAGFNGIIGLGSFVEDCSVSTSGANPCTTSATKAYWSCRGTTCKNNYTVTGDVTVPTSDQIANPVAYMPTNYNNGLVIRLPAVSSSGAGAAYGYLVMGIGSDSNNSASSATAFTIENDGTFKQATYKNQVISYAFIDSGTNFYGMPQVNSDPPLCSQASDFFCPSSQQTLSALVESSSSVTRMIYFDVGNMVSLASQDPRSMVYNNIAFAIDDTFDLGLPFFLGRSVFVGIKGKSSSVGGSPVSGPFWAF